MLIQSTFSKMAVQMPSQIFQHYIAHGMRHGVGVVPTVFQVSIVI
jgi:hypothetical protein